MSSKKPHPFIKLMLAYAFAAILVLGVNSCPNNCLFCLDQSKCITCQNQYYLTTQDKCLQPSLNENAVENCRVYYPRNSNSQNLNCAICQSTFKLENGQCIKDLSGCLRRDIDGKCIECNFGTTLNIQGECLGVVNCAKPQRTCEQCRRGYNLINNRCIHSEPNCRIIQSNGLCSECRDDYILNGFECISKASSSVTNGNINLVEKCSLFSRFEQRCLQCESGYELFNNQCQSKGQVYESTLNQANRKIRQESTSKFIGDKSEQINYKKITYSVGGDSERDDVLTTEDPKETTKVTFQGVGAQPSDDHCLIRGANSQQCQVCIDGYYLSINGLCVKRTPVCVRYNLTNFSCLECNVNYALVNGECIDQNCEESLFSECQVCKPGFTKTPEGICRDENCQRRSNGLCVQCISGYVLSEDHKLCYRIIPNCLNYSPNRQFCLECESGFTIGTQGVCQRQTNARCIQLNTTNPSQCLRCRDQFALLPNGTCSDLYCAVLSPQNSSRCIICQPGYILHSNHYCYDQNCVLYSNGTCTNCANNYKLQNKYCVKVIIGCLQVYPTNQTCKQCLDVYKLSNGRCIFNESDRCSRYNPNQTINGTSVCAVCKSSYKLQNNRCIDPLCQNEQFRDNFYACIQCKAGYNLTINGSCYDEHCLQVSSGSCVRCADEYVISPSGLCIKTTVACLTWDENTQRCANCFPGYQLHSSGYCELSSEVNGTTSSTVDQVDTLTPEQIENSNNGSETPLNQQEGSSTTDSNGSSENSLCRTRDSSNQCTGCVTGRYYIRNNECEPVPDVCRSYNPRTGKCILCESGYALYNSSNSQYQDCIQKPTQDDPFCVVRDLNKFCIRCKTGYYISNGICYLADTQCKTFQLIGGQCLTCYEGFTIEGSSCISLTNQSKCKTYDFQNTCIECVDRYYSDNGVCRKVSDLCGNYEMLTGRCLACAQGYTLINGACTKIDHSELIQNCVNYLASGICVECANRYYLSDQSTCLLVNPLCNDYEVRGGRCKNCTEGYVLIQEAGQCVLDGYDPNCAEFSYEGLCQTCTEGYFLTTNLLCVQIDPLCQEYNTVTGKCNLCVDTHYLTFEECQPKFQKQSLSANCLQGDLFKFCTRCQDRYFISAGDCLPVSDLCQTYNVNTGACLSCYGGYTLRQNGECVLSITDQTDSSISDSSSANSNLQQSNCKLFSGFLCIECVDRFYLNSGADVSQPTCEPVNELCLEYNMFNGDCYSCVQGHRLVGAICVPTLEDDGGVQTQQNAQSQESTTTTTNSSNVVNPDTLTNSDDDQTQNNLQGGMVQFMEISQLDCQKYDLQLNKCVQCYQGFFYSESAFRCEKIDSNCQTYDPVNLWCLSCNLNYELRDGICVETSTTTSIKEPQDVLTDQSTSESSSSSNSFAQNCQTYNPIQSRCITCNNGYQLLTNGTCSLEGPNIITDPFCTSVTESRCINCLAGYYVDSLTGKCTLQSILCAQFNVIGGECSRCTTGNILQDGQCFTPAFGIDENCNLYNGVFCAGCNTGYRLESFVCQPIS